MIGNDVNEDIIGAGKAGLGTYLVTDCQIGDDSSIFAPSGTFADLIEYLEKRPDKENM